MLRFVVSETKGAGDLLIARVAARLEAAGVPLAGAVQVNAQRHERRRADMDLDVLPRGAARAAPRVRISQDLGDGAIGCRLDPEGLERAVAQVEAHMARVRPALLIVNKFGKQELTGRGFYPVIGAALADDIPVLLGVHRTNLAGFLAFAEGLAEPLSPDEAAILDWCRDATGLAVPQDRAEIG